MNQPFTARLRIGALADELDLNPKTIRYYEEIGLLPAPERTPVGYRLYGPSDRERLRLIGQAKALGLTLSEVGEILDLPDGGQPPCTHVLEMLDRKLAAVDKQLRTLAELRSELLGLREEAVTTAQTGAQVCGIIERHNSTS